MTRESFYIMAILMLIAAVVLLVAEVLVQKNEIKELLGRRDKKDKPKQQAESVIKHNGICLTCYFKNNYSLKERDIFRDDTKQVADCWLYMKKVTAKEDKNESIY